MKKQSIIITIVVLLLATVIIGGTYAFFSSGASTELTNSESLNFEVIYTGGTKIEGPINLTTKENNDAKLSTVVNIRVAEGSALAKATIYMNIEKMTQNLSIPGFIWEVYGNRNGEQVYYTGTFDGYNDTTNKTFNLIEDYPLSEDNAEFTIYLWLDGNLVGNEVLGAEFKSYIAAKTENFTAALK